MQYRSEIDGLRAIAVIPVIFFHAGLFGFSGGYAGVDVFFVISGYLITRIILDELEQDKFSIKKFYQRRARRILPALFSVLIVTTLIAIAVMPSELLKSYANSVLSVVTFTSNFHFFSVSGYFSTAAEQKPLLHTWSLAVEEQYYLFFPLLLLYLFSKGKIMHRTIIVLTLASLLLSQYMASKQIIDANFYLISSRAWELFFGSLISLYQLDRTPYNKASKQFGSILGLLMIVVSFFYYDSNTIFPSFYTLLPVLGTCFVIVFADKHTLVGKLLSIKAVVAIGLISYSLYLWHQPLFAFLRMKSLGEPSELLFLIAIALTFVLAALSYRFIETPFRKSVRFLEKDILKLSAKWIGSAILLAGLILASDGMQFRFSTELDKTVQHNPKRKQCHTKGTDYLPPKDACRYFNDNTTWASLGDSHTVELAYALAKQLEAHKQGIIHLSFSGCSPALTFDVNKKGCHQWLNEAVTFLEQQTDVENVLLGFRYSAFLFGDHGNIYPDIPDLNINDKIAAGFKKDTPEEAHEMYWQSFKQIVDRLLAAGKKIYIVYPIPELPDHIVNLLTPFSVFGGGYMYDLYETTPVSYYQERNSFILNKLNSLPYGDKIKAIEPLKALCSDRYCPAVKNDKALYFDDGHLSLAGAALVLEHAHLEFK